MTASGAEGAVTARVVSVIPGDGIGPEVVRATVRVLEAMKLPLRFEECEAGNEVVSRLGTNLPRETIESVLRNRVALKGPTETTVGVGLPSAHVGLRKAVDRH